MRQTYARVDLSQYQDNLKAIRSCLRPGVLLMAVVKADAYGHGLVPSAFAAKQAGIDALGVAIAEEGIKLRQAGMDLPILVLSSLQAQSTLEAVRHGLTLTCFTPEHLQNAAAACYASGLTSDIHLKLDTGMNRVGVQDEEHLQSLLDLLATLPQVHLRGAFTHFSCADSADPAFTNAQLACFKRFTALLPQGILLHAANSAALLTRSDAHFGMVRAGICSYGYPPVATNLPLLPVMSLLAEINHIKDISKGDAVSYGAAFVANGPMRVATLAMGYGDGYHRAMSGIAQVLINGVRCPVLGRICMDQVVVDISQAGPVRVGEQAVVIGNQGDASITAEDLAKWAGTISYEVLLSLTNRVPRHYN